MHARDWLVMCLAVKRAWQTYIVRISMKLCRILCIIYSFSCKCHFFPFTRMEPCGAWTKHTWTLVYSLVHSQRFEIYEIHLGNRIGLHRAHVSNDCGASRAHGWRHALRRVELSAVLKGQSMVHPLMPVHCFLNVHWFLDCSAIFINLWVVIAFFSIWCI